MSKTKILLVAVIILGLLNVSILVFASMRTPPGQGGHPTDGIKTVIIKKLNFDDNQQDAYEQLITEHQTQIKEQEEQIRDIKNKLYGNLSINDQRIEDDLIRQLGSTSMMIEQIHYDHFIGIKNLCKEEQLGLFNELQSELGRLFAKPPPKKR